MRCILHPSKVLKLLSRKIPLKSVAIPNNQGETMGNHSSNEDTMKPTILVPLTC